MGTFRHLLDVLKNSKKIEVGQLLLALQSPKFWSFFSKNQEKSLKSEYFITEVAQLQKYDFFVGSYYVSYFDLSIIMRKEIVIKIFNLENRSSKSLFCGSVESLGSEILTKMVIFHRVEENVRRFFSETYLDILSTRKVISSI